MKLLFVALFSMFICAQLALAQADTESLEASKTVAAKFMEAGDYQMAYSIYAALLWDYPDDDEVNLGIAISARQVDRVYPALMALERLSFKYPRDMQIRRELLIVYLEVNDLESARREAEILRQNDIDISGLNILPSPSFLYSGYLAFGTVYNTNANAGMESNEIMPGLFLNDAEKVASPGTYAQGALNGSYKLGASWWLVGDVNAYYHYNTAAELVNNTDILWLRAAAGARYASSRYLADLRFKVDRTQQGSDTGDQTIMAYGIDGQFVYGLRQNITLTTSLTLDTKGYNQSEARNGLYYSLGESIRILFGSKTAELTLGGRLMQASTDEPVYDYTGWEASARMAFYIGRFELIPSAAYRKESYDGKPSFLDTENREDTQLRAGLSFRWRFYEDWSTELSYQHTKNSSNSILYEYSQHLISANMAVFF